MARFIYRMQNILDIKQKMEDQNRMEYGLAQIRLNEAMELLEILQRRRAAQLDAFRELLTKGELIPRDMKEYNAVISHIDRERESQKIRVKQAENELEVQRKKLQSAIQERKVQEKLREHAFERFLQEEKEKESKEIDELTSYVYGQKVGMK